MREKKRLEGELRKNNKTLNIIVVLIILVIIVFLTPKIISTAKYVYNNIHHNYIASKDFYFSSDKLVEGGTEFLITNNWDGAQTRDVLINMTSKRNDKATTAADITYTIDCSSCSDNIECTASKGSGTIYGTDTLGANTPGVNEDSFYIHVSPKNGTPLPNTAKAWVEVIVTSTAPYEQILRGKLMLEVGSSSVYYEISDSVNSPYLMVNIVNSSAQNASVTLSYNPQVVLLDMTNHFYIDNTARTLQQIGGYNYINTITANVASLSTTSVKFYKITASNNYTYTSDSVNVTPIITMTAN